MPSSAASRFSFPPAHRVLTRAQFQRVFDNNRRSSDGLFAVLAGDAVDDGRRRVGITVSKKVSRKAVERNRIKRLVRESFRHLDSSQPAADYVVIARTRCATSTNEEIRASLDRHWRRLADGKSPGRSRRRRR